MGDQISQEVDGFLNYVPIIEFNRILNSPVPDVKKAEIFAGFCRINSLYMISNAGSGHIGSSFSSMDIITWLYLFELKGDINNIYNENGDIFFSSKGHDAPALYSVLIGLGKLNFDLIHSLRKLGGLPGHPDISTPNIITNTGSLGMGISKAKGMIYANRKMNKRVNVFVLTGDGELQEGQFWESLASAANHKLQELTVIIDHNKLQSDSLVSKVSDLGDLESKLLSFGWHVRRCDGNNLISLSNTLEDIKSVKDKPKIIIADTIKGKGVSFMEHTSIDSDVDFYKFHSGAPTKDAYGMAVSELIEFVNLKLNENGLTSVYLQIVEQNSINVIENNERLIPSYSKSLLEQARINSKIIALDADLILDTGLIPFKEEFPERFVECGIAEQDMVSQAGGMALRGLIPVVHSFACFLTARPYEQIYNNSTEKSKIIYVGSLAGVLPSGPGHSHQALHDITTMSSIPNMVCIEPVSAIQVQEALNWASELNKFSTYLRLTSVPIDFFQEIVNLRLPKIGQGNILTEGNDFTLIISNPIILVEAMKAFVNLKSEGIFIKIISLPWLNKLDLYWINENLKNDEKLLICENHSIDFGFSDFVISKIFIDNKIRLRTIIKLGIEGIPVCGKPKEVLEYHKMDSNSISQIIKNSLNA